MNLRDELLWVFQKWANSSGKTGGGLIDGMIRTIAEVANANMGKIEGIIENAVRYVADGGDYLDYDTDSAKAIIKLITGVEVEMKQPNVAIEGEFNDISSEVFRQYEFPSGQVVRIEHPSWLHISTSGGHRIIDAMGLSHYVPCGWGHLFWQVVDGEPYFVR